MILRGRAGAAEGGLRLDEAAHRLFPQLSKTMVRKIIDWGGCTLGGGMVRVASRAVQAGDEIILGVMEPADYREHLLSPSDILYEDAEYLGAAKPAGINAQRTPHQLKGTMEHAVSRFFQERGISEPVRIVHRLDRGTSGVMFFPKNRKSAAHLSSLFAGGGVEKLYWAVSDGVPQQQEWEVDAAIGKVGPARYGIVPGWKESLTLFRLLSRSEDMSLLECRPRTGRTHQIRVHLASCSLPIVGDATYGGSRAPRMLLHCRTLSFRAAGGKEISATAPPDEAFRQVCRERRLEVPE